jgi:hypothetical protein
MPGIWKAIAVPAAMPVTIVETRRSAAASRRPRHDAAGRCHALTETLAPSAAFWRRWGAFCVPSRARVVATPHVYRRRTIGMLYVTQAAPDEGTVVPHEIPDGWIECEEGGCASYFCTTCGRSYARGDPMVERDYGRPICVAHLITDTSEVWERHQLTPVRRQAPA